jgi:hypothetical protein
MIIGVFVAELRRSIMDEEEEGESKGQFDWALPATLLMSCSACFLMIKVSGQP